MSSWVTYTAFKSASRIVLIWNNKLCIGIFSLLVIFNFMVVLSFWWCQYCLYRFVMGRTPAPKPQQWCLLLEELDALSTPQRRGLHVHLLVASHYRWRNCHRWLRWTATQEEGESHLVWDAQCTRAQSKKLRSSLGIFLVFGKFGFSSRFSSSSIITNTVLSLLA